MKTKKKKAITLIELMIAILIVGIVAAVVIPILRAKTNAAKDEDFKAGYFASGQFKQIVGEDSNQVKKAKDAVDRFQRYMYGIYSGCLHLASTEDKKNHLKQSKVEDPAFDERVLDGLLKFKESYESPVIKGVKK